MQECEKWQKCTLWTALYFLCDTWSSMLRRRWSWTEWFIDGDEELEHACSMQSQGEFEFVVPMLQFDAMVQGREREREIYITTLCLYLRSSIHFYLCTWYDRHPNPAKFYINSNTSRQASVLLGRTNSFYFILWNRERYLDILPLQSRRQTLR